MHDSAQQRVSPWPHRLVVALALVTFPLIWVGGLVTTYDAGMAVPDWPGTYGYNLLLYPWQSWLAAPWDLFIEHGHRLLGALAGLLCLALVAVTMMSDSRRWLHLAAIAALVLVIVQGALGGARVLLDARLVALIHGCLGPFFFAYLAALVVSTGRNHPRDEIELDAKKQRLIAAAWTLVGLAYMQIVLGAIVRHMPLEASPQWFRAALFLHLLVAGGVVLQIAWTTMLARQEWKASKRKGFVGLSALLCGLVAAQFALGLGTYVVKYSWPGWMADYPFAAGFVVEEKSLLQSLITTAHVANGSLILFVSTLLAMRGAIPFFAFHGSRTIWQPTLQGGLVA